MPLSGRFGRLLAVVALVIVACSPHRPLGVVRQGAASGASDVIQVAFNTVGLDSVIIKRSTGSELMTVDDGRRLLQGGALLALLVLVTIAGLRPRWSAPAFDAARGGVLAATALARLRAPPTPL